MKLGILDIGRDLEASVALATRADALGYTRYWIAEHQPQPSPILLAAILAGLTERIRVGTAGILFHYYPPLRTAHDFHFLERAYPGRIDAGFCAGITQNPVHYRDDLDCRNIDEIFATYEQRVGRFVRHLRNTRANQAFDSITAWAGVSDHPPQIWSLGGRRSASLAIEHHLAFAYGLLYYNSRDEPEVAATYRRRFSQRQDDVRPLIAIAVAGMCAASDAEAQRWRDAYPGKFFMPRIVGSPSTCAIALEELRARYGADEVIFADLCPSLVERLACHELLAAAAIDLADGK